MKRLWQKFLVLIHICPVCKLPLSKCDCIANGE